MVALRCASASPDAPLRLQYDYCIIGAGPGGVQAAIYFQQLGMDYAVFERSPRAGDFFYRFPRQRRLISINKRFTGNSDKEFQIRHDWNSLIVNFDSGTEGIAQDLSARHPLFTNYSEEYFPNAGLIVDYLTDVVEAHQLHVKLSHEVTGVWRQSARPTAPFVLEVSPGGTDKRSNVKCRVVIMAVGRDVPMKLRPEAEAFVEGYESMDVTPATFRDKTVAILGTGNAALEIADAIQNDAAYVHLASRYPMSLAWQSHYVGHARGLNLQILDRYQFKSLDALIHGFGSFDRFQFRRDNATKKIVIQVGNDAVDANEENPQGMSIKYDRVLRCLGFVWNQSVFASPPPTATASCTMDVKESVNGDECGSGRVASFATVTPFSEPKQRYMEVASNFESVNVPRLFVAGTLMHFRDFKRTSGGFIHGFRYLIRTMVLQLRERFERKPYPSIRFGPYDSVKAAAEPLAQLLLRRLVNVSSLYQLPGQVVDVLILDETYNAGITPANTSFALRLVRDVPIDQLNSTNTRVLGTDVLRRARSFMTVSIEFGKEFQGMGLLHHHAQPETPWRKQEKQLWDTANDPDVRIGTATAPSTARPRRDDIPVEYAPFHPQKAPTDDVDDYNEVPFANGYYFIHPVFRVFRRTGEKHSRPKMIMEFGLREELHNEWLLPKMHVAPLERFLAASLPKLVKGTATQRGA